MNLFIMWTALLGGLAVLVTGARTIAGRQAPLPWMREHLGSRQHGWALVLLGVFPIFEVLPRLAGFSDWLVMAFSLLAFGLLAGFITLQVGPPLAPLASTPKVAARPSR